MSLIRPRSDGIYVDCTVGPGGHAEALLEAGAGRLIGLDRDAAALAVARPRLAAYGDRVDLVQADYRELAQVLSDRGLARIDGALADLGVSSLQLDDPARGFSFRQDGPLDMRMNPSIGASAAELLRTTDESTLADVIFRFGDERHARRIARAIVQARTQQPLTRTAALASVVRRAAGGRGWQRIDPATRTFQALRIWVNRELEGLDLFIETAVDALRAGGRLVDDRVSFTRGSRGQAHVSTPGRRRAGSACHARDAPADRGGRRRGPAQPAVTQCAPARSGEGRMSIDVEYAIKKDIRNNPVVREVDVQQKRDFLRTTCIALLIVAMGLFAAWQHFKILQNGYEVQKLQQARAAEESVNRKLRLEVEMLRAPQRIERIALHDLRMVSPVSKDTLVIERATPSAPDQAVVAAAR